ncbi:hypothetical protein DSECCO2_328930 [anaerobic digester metagenome]
MPWRNQNTERYMENKPDYKIFTPSGCLSPEGMAFYVQGSLSTAETALVIDHLEHCEMCALAVEGYRLSVPGEFSEDLVMLEASFIQMTEDVPEIIDEAIPAVSSNFEGPRFPRLSKEDIRIFSDSIMRDRQTADKEARSIPTAIKRKAGFLSRHKPVLLAASVLFIIAATGGWLFFEMNKSGNQREFASAIEKENTTAGTALPADPADSAEALPAPASSVIIQDKQRQSIGIPQPEPTDVIEIVSDNIEIDAEITASEEEYITTERMPPLDVKKLQEPSIHKSEGYTVAEQLAVQDTETVYIQGVQLSENKSKRMKGKTAVEEEVAEAEIFMVVEEAPVYPGGDEERSKFFSENLRYPHEAREASVEGTVYVTFVIERDGSLSDIKILRGLGYGLDDEVLRVMRLMPRWIPGKQRGKPVRVQYNMPVKFTLTGYLMPEK